MMAAVKPEGFGGGYDQINWSGSGGADAPALQVTAFIYGADVVDGAGGPISANNAFIKEVQFPKRTDGQPSAADALLFTYYSDGSVATRTDQRGMVFMHTYDELGRRVNTAIDDTAWYGLPQAGQTDHSPPNRVCKLGYTYHGDGALAGVTAYTRTAGGAEQVLADNWFAYDGRGNLLADWQAHGGMATGTTPKTVYTWSFSPAPDAAHPGGMNYDRLASIGYPLSQTGAMRAVGVQYGSSSGGSDPQGRLDRIASLTWGNAGQAGATMAGYEYAGTSRRAEKGFAPSNLRKGDANGMNC